MRWDRAGKLERRASPTKRRPSSPPRSSRFRVLRTRKWLHTSQPTVFSRMWWLTLRPQLDGSQRCLEALLIGNDSQNFVRDSTTCCADINNTGSNCENKAMYLALGVIIPFRLRMHLRSRFLSSDSLDNSWS